MESKTTAKNVEEYVVEEMTEVCGSFGAWQRRVFVLSFLSCFPAAWHNLGIAFFAFPKDHWCAKPSHLENITADRWKELAIPKVKVKGIEKYSQCEMYNLQNFTDSAHWLTVRQKTVPCESWDFDHSYFASTIVDQWQLVCEDSWMVSMSQSIYMVGFLIAVLVCGQMGDKFGRRPIALFCIAVLQASALAMIFSASFTFYVIMRFFVALGAAGLFTTCFVILMEVCGPKKRPIMGTLTGIGWTTGLLSLTGLAWLIRDWHRLQITFVVPGFILFLFWWRMPESPRWLLSQGRIDEARDLLEKAADENGMSCATIYVQSGAFFRGVEKRQKQASDDEAPKKANILDLLKTANLRKKTLVLFFCWFVVSFIYYGLSLNTSDLGGDPFVNFGISAAVEIPSFFAGYYVITRLGRRRPMAVMYMLGGAACLLTIPVTDELLWLRITLAMFGKLCIAAAFATVYIYSAELYPTVVRNVGVGSSSTCARVGSIIAPFVKELGKATSLSVPLGIFGVMSAACGLLALLLPETHNQRVPDTIQQGEAFGKKVKTSDKKKKEDAEKGETNFAAETTDVKNT